MATSNEHLMAVGSGEAENIQRSRQNPANYFLPGPYLASTLTAIPDTYIAESASNSNTCSGLSYPNYIFPNSATNMFRRQLPLPNAAPPSNFPLQMEGFPVIRTNNFYNRSGAHNILTASGHMPPPTVSLMNVFNVHRPDAESTKNQKCVMCRTNYQVTPPIESDSSKKLQFQRKPMTHLFLEEFNDECSSTELKLIVRKEMSKSDVRNVGRIVLPKKVAEANLPQLTDGDGIILNMDDFVFPVSWKFKYRFWPNNKSRMYIMEGTGDFVRAHGLHSGDCFIIYRNSTSGKYVVRGKKRTQQSAQVEMNSA